MKYLRSALTRIAGAFTRDAGDEDLREEFQAHLDMETAENVRRGMAPDAARRQALLNAGGLTQAAEAVRDQRGLPWVESVGADVKYAWRALRHSPAFAAVVVATLALGIGANTAIFSVVRGVLLKPLPHRDGGRLVYLRQSMDGTGGENLSFSVPEVRDIRAGARSLAALAEFSEWSVSLLRNDGAARMPVGLVTGNYFGVMGLAPILGRVMDASNDGPGVPIVMVLTHEGWMNRFGGDSGVIGRVVKVDDKPATIIGVLQAAPFFPGRADALLNMVASEHHLSAFMVEGRVHRMTELVARLTPDATVQQARGEVQATYERMTRDHKEAYNPGLHYRVAVIPFRKVIGERASLTLWLLMGAAVFVMIITAANVANLTLMRGVRREHELVVRAALGAGVARLRRLLLVENLFLTLGGAAIGLVIAVAGVRLLTSFAARYSPRADEISLDGTVLGFTLLLSVAVALLLAFLASLPRDGAFASWISGAARMTGNLGKSRLQRALVIVQVAVSVMLLAGAGLLTRTMIRLSNVQTGLRTEEILTIQFSLLTPPQTRDPAADANAKDRYERMRLEAAALPGVTEVGIGSPMPLRRSDVPLEVKIEGKVFDAREAPPRAEIRTADPNFFRAAGIPLLRGRYFEATDRWDGAKVVIINQTLADQLFPGEDPVGKNMAWTGEILKFTPFGGEWRTIVGVVASTQDGGLDAKPVTSVYMPFSQVPAIGGGLVIRADSNVARLVAPATQIVRRIAPTTPIDRVQTISQVREESVAPRRLNAALISSFGLLAVIIAAVGIAGVLAFSVSARTTEIGIRMSLGADPGRVQRMILGEGGTLLLIGLVAGGAGALLAARVIRGLLFGIEPNDPTTLVGVALMMAAIGLVACWVPALRAARIDPAITMRAQ